MKKFISDNSNAIVKFLLTHVVMSVLGIMVGLAVLSIEGEGTTGFSLIAIIGSLFTVGFMCFMHYDDMYFIAEKDGIRARAEGLEPDKFKGIKITLLAYSPVILITIVAVIISLVSSDDTSTVSQLVFYAFQGSFISLYALRQFIGFARYALVSLLPAIISSVLGYYLGQKDKTLRGLFGMNVKPPYDGPIERKPKK